MSSLRRHEGWLLIDHTASPGLPEHVARLAGYDPKFCGEGKKYETSTVPCSHCGCSVVKNPFRIRAREHCRKCDHYICDGCHALSTLPDYVHIPFRARAERAINSALKGEAVDPAAPQVTVPRIVVP